MNHYIELTLLPDAQISQYFLWSKVYQQIHLALVTSKNTSGKLTIGAGFPGYHHDKEKKIYRLGNKVRLFAATPSELDKLTLEKWLLRLTDYVHITSIRNVPDKVSTYASFKRLRPKSNNERLARRRAKRKNISLDEARAHFQNRKEVYSQAPYIRIKSTSSGRQFRLLIAQEEKPPTAHNNEQGFDSYGLSATSSVPIF